MANCWFGSRWFGIRIGIPLRNNPFHSGVSLNPNHELNHQGQRLPKEASMAGVGLDLRKLPKRPRQLFKEMGEGDKGGLLY